MEKMLDVKLCLAYGGALRNAKESTVQVKQDMRLMGNQLYMYEQIDALKTEAMKKKAQQLCEGVTQKFKIDEILRKMRRDAKNEN